MGAPSRLLGADVVVASPGAGRDGLSLLLTTLSSEGSVTEPIPIGLKVAATTAAGEAGWIGASNDEGIADIWLALPKLHPGDRVQLSATTDDGRVLAAGAITVPPPPAQDPTATSEVRATRKTGELALEVYVYGGKLVPGVAERVFVRTRDAATRLPIDGVHLTAEAEPGLAVDRSFGASTEGWSEAAVTAEFLLASWTLTATAGARTGSWYGALPVGAGGASAHPPLRVDPETPLEVALSVPIASRRLYVEVDDRTGRDFGDALTVNPIPPRGGMSTEIPGLAPGLYWLVTSVDSSALGGASASTVARPFRVGKGAPLTLPEAASLAALAPPVTARTKVLDGLTLPRRRADARTWRGLSVALGAVVVAMALETLLILRAARRAKRQMLALTDAFDLAGVPAARPESAHASIAVLVLATLLGFALLASLLLVRG